jgi:ribulose-phosphate 3-epimerase
MQHYRIVPAIIAQSQDELDQLLRKIEGLFEWVMLDFMDGLFVPTRSLLFDIRLPGSFIYEAHLMVNKPLNFLPKLKDKVKMVILHVESEGFKQSLIKAKTYGFEVSAAINPSTPTKEILNYVLELDRILVMTVKPGQYGAPFIPSVLRKIEEIRKIDSVIPIEVDGAMNPDTIKLARSAGATIFASGSYLMRSQDVLNAKKNLLSAIFDG